MKEKLKKLEEMYENKIITTEEYQNKRQEILDDFINGENDENINSSIRKEKSKKFIIILISILLISTIGLMLAIYFNDSPDYSIPDPDYYGDYSGTLVSYFNINGTTKTDRLIVTIVDENTIYIEYPDGTYVDYSRYVYDDGVLYVSFPEWDLTVIGSSNDSRLYYYTSSPGTYGFSITINLYKE